MANFEDKILDMVVRAVGDANSVGGDGEDEIAGHDVPSTSK